MFSWTVDFDIISRFIWSLLNLSLFHCHNIVEIAYEYYTRLHTIIVLMNLVNSSKIPVVLLVPKFSESTCLDLAKTCFNIVILNEIIAKNNTSNLRISNNQNPSSRKYIVLSKQYWYWSVKRKYIELWIIVAHLGQVETVKPQMQIAVQWTPFCYFAKGIVRL